MPDHLDGNALAGPLAAAFTFDVTTARAACATCADTRPLADAHVYGTPMGLIAHCSSCHQVLLRATVINGAITLDLRGIARLRVR
jgi:hypothetical protein